MIRRALQLVVYGMLALLYGKKRSRSEMAGAPFPSDPKEKTRVITELYEIAHGIRDRQSIVEYEVDGKKYRFKYDGSAQWVK